MVSEYWAASKWWFSFIICFNVRDLSLVCFCLFCLFWRLHLSLYWEIKIALKSGDLASIPKRAIHSFFFNKATVKSTISILIFYYKWFICAHCYHFFFILVPSLISNRQWRILQRFNDVNNPNNPKWAKSSSVLHLFFSHSRSCFTFHFLWN